MAAAIILGVCAGGVGFFPLFFGIRMIRRVTINDQPGGKVGLAGLSLLCVFASFVILFGCLALCIVNARELLVPFAMAEVATLIVVAIAFAMVRMFRK